MNRQRSDAKRERIAAAFMRMLEDTPLENLRIQELCVQAGVSKATFYRLFPDKYEVGNWIYKSRVDRIISEHPYLRCWSDWTMLNFSEMLKHRRFFRNIASYRGAELLSGVFGKLLLCQRARLQECFHPGVNRGSAFCHSHVLPCRRTGDGGLDHAGLPARARGGAASGRALPAGLYTRVFSIKPGLAHSPFRTRPFTA